jgi:hypothetical protein
LPASSDNLGGVAQARKPPRAAADGGRSGEPACRTLFLQRSEVSWSQVMFACAKAMFVIMIKP